MQFTAKLRQEYARDLDTAEIDPARLDEINGIVRRILEDRGHYEVVAKSTGVPWYVIALIHERECSGRFDQHLHNGDGLAKKTWREPKNRPPGPGPWTWEESAADALTYDGFTRWSDWSPEGTLYKFEGYNGWGYRSKHVQSLSPGIRSPYIWGGSSLHRRGKFVRDGIEGFSPTAVEKQIGLGVLLVRLLQAQTAAIHVGIPVPKQPLKAGVPVPVVRYGIKGEAAAALQRWLNTLPGVFVHVDGIPGKRTSDAFYAATGCYVAGDPRGRGK